MPATRGAVVVVVPRAQRHQLAVTVRAELDVENRRRRRVPDDELLLPGQHEAERTSDVQREQREERFKQRHLSPKTTTHRHRHDTYLVRRNLEEFGDVITHLE